VLLYIIGHLVADDRTTLRTYMLIHTYVPFELGILADDGKVVGSSEVGPGLTSF